MFIANGNWQWYWDENAQRLAILLDDDRRLVTGYGSKELRGQKISPTQFSMSHMQIYTELEDKIDLLPMDLSELQQTQIALNGTAALVFHKPVALKSWHFLQHTAAQEVIFATLETDQDCAVVLVLETTANICTCMLLSEYLSITETKNLMQFGLVKVNSDRLLPIELLQPLQKRA
jgi:cell division protein ZapC